MRIVFRIDVGIDVPSYVQAGEVLDRLTREIEAAVGPKGSYDIQDFRAKHRPVHLDEMPTMATRGARVEEGAYAPE